jgi:hypothetical protein
MNLRRWDLNLEQRVQQLEITNLYRAVTLRLIQIYDEKRTKGKKKSGGELRHLARLPPRLIRFRDAPHYLGMDKNRFKTEVRPYLTEIPIGKQGIAFDRLDLDTWVDQYKDRNGRPGKQKGVKKPWDERRSPALSTGKGRGTSIRLSEEEEFAKALERVTSKKRKDT